MKVAEPLASPLNVNVGSAVAVVAILTFPKLVIVAEPVTAPVTVIVGSFTLISIVLSAS